MVSDITKTIWPKRIIWYNIWPDIVFVLKKGPEMDKSSA